MHRKKSQKWQRLRGIVLLVSGLGLGLGLTMMGLRDTMVFFYSPLDLKTMADKPTGIFRLGGLVKTGSIQKQDGTATITFVITDGAEQFPVTYTGLLPDLFREGQGVIAEGVLDGEAGIFEAKTILARHDENYRPPEVTDALEKAKLQKGEAVKASQKGSIGLKEDGYTQSHTTSTLVQPKDSPRP